MFEKELVIFKNAFYRNLDLIIKQNKQTKKTCPSSYAIYQCEKHIMRKIQQIAKHRSVSVLGPGAQQGKNKNPHGGR